MSSLISLAAPEGSFEAKVAAKTSEVASACKRLVAFGSDITVLRYNDHHNK